MAFVKVRQWAWKHFTRGTMTIMTDENATEQQVRSYIGKDPSLGGSGNYDPKSLTNTLIKVKQRKTILTKI